MVVKIIDKNTLIVGCDNKVLLERIQATTDGAKVRRENKILIPMKSGPKLINFIDQGIEWDDEVKKAIKLVSLNSDKRREVIQRIKDQYKYKQRVKFDYDYKGSYVVMEHQKVFFNMIVYPDVSALIADTGTCKTGPYLWAIDKRIQTGKIKKSLIITLSDLKKNILTEMQIQVPHLRGVILDGKTKSDMIINQKYKQKKHNKEYDIYIANYESMSSLIKIIPEDFFDMVILDEAHRIGSNTSNQTKAIVGFFENVKYKHIVSATLISNNLMSFFMPYRFLGPDTVPFAKYSEFRGNFMHPIDINQFIWKANPGSYEKVTKIIGDLAVKFTKEECIDLPVIIEETYTCKMEGGQSNIYKEMKRDLITTIDNMCEKCTCKDACDRSCEGSLVAKNALIVIQKLQQIAFGFYINTHAEIQSDGKSIQRKSIIRLDENPKLNLLVQILNNIPSDRKIIIWCNYTFGIDLIKERLSSAFGKDTLLTCYMDCDAFEVIQKFRDPQYRFLIANPKKMAAGHNIQFSNYSVFVTCSYSYIQYDQAVGRQYRKGQTEKVTIIKLATEDTVDLTILQALKYKMDLSMSLSQWARVLRED